MKPAQSRDMLNFFRVFFFWGGGVQESVCHIFFFKYCIGQKMGISNLDHEQEYFFNFISIDFELLGNDFIMP